MSDVEKEDLPADEAPEIAAPPEEPAAAEPEAPAAEAPAAQPAPAPQAAPAPAPAAQAPEAAQEQAPDATLAPATLTPQEYTKQRLDRNLPYGQDLAEGKIKPGSIFHDKTLLGKFGTIFGLMLSSAGAGLSHSPNALLEMMNKEIERDVEAQKANVANKQNAYRLSLEHNRVDNENALRGAQTLEAKAKLQQTMFMNDKMGVSQDAAKADLMDYESMEALHHQQTIVDSMAPGPRRDTAQSILDDSKAFMLNASIKRHTAVGAKAQVAAAQGQPAQPEKPEGNPPPPPNKVADPGARYDAYNESKYTRMSNIGDLWGEEKAIAMGGIPHSAQARIQEDAAKQIGNRNNYADAVRSFNYLDGLSNAGESPGVNAAAKIGTTLAGLIPGSSHAETMGPALQKTLESERISQMEALIGKLTRGGVGKEQAKDMVEAWMPSWKDTPKQREEKFQQIKLHFTGMPEDKPLSLKRFGLWYDPPNYQFRDKRKGTGKLAPEDKEATQAPGMGNNKQ